jgi:FMN reductase
MLIVGLGGTTRPGSSSETALRCALEVAAEGGARVLCFGAEDLRFPLYDPTQPERSSEVTRFLRAVEQADGFVVASPGYHGTVSGLVKNALDYVEDLVAIPRPYFADRPVGCISVAHGWQAAVNTLRTLRDIVHALRGWPTPYGVALNPDTGAIAGGVVRDEELRASLRLVGQQVMDFVTHGYMSPADGPTVVAATADPYGRPAKIRAARLNILPRETRPGRTG